MRKDFVKEVNPCNKTVLDVGTGTGSLAIDLSASAEKVIGIDLSVSMLAMAKRKRRSGNLAFIHMDATQMTFDDESFDLVTIGLALHDMPLDIRFAVLEQVKRVLKKDGRLYIWEYDLPGDRTVAAPSSQMINIMESRHFLEFVHSDFDAFLKSMGFRIEIKKSYLFHFLRSLVLSK